MNSSYRIAEISFGRAERTAPYDFEYKGKSFEVQRFGANYSIPYMVDLMKGFRTQVDAIAVTGLPHASRLGSRTYFHPDVMEIMTIPTSVPLCDGAYLREIAIVNGLRALLEQKVLDLDRGVFFPVGLIYSEAATFLSGLAPGQVGFGDLCTLLGIPKVVLRRQWTGSIAKALAYYIATTPLRDVSPVGRNSLKSVALTQLPRIAKPYHYIFAGSEYLSSLQDLSFLESKSLIVPYAIPHLHDNLERARPKQILSLYPKNLQLHPQMSYPVLDATLRLSAGKKAQLSVEEWQEVLNLEPRQRMQTREYVTNQGSSLHGRIQRQAKTLRRILSKENDPVDFAFVVHALSRADFSRVPGFRWLETAPISLQKNVEKLGSKIPGFLFGEVRNIISKKTKEPIRGLIYALSSTPRILKEEPVDETYRKIERICYDAAERGARVLGLGAYIKVVGDAGATMNRMSPIPVTTGNSLSASATLWALHEALQKMNHLQRRPGSQHFSGTAMVIGATGSIGSVSAKLLSFIVTRLILIGPRRERLQDLQNEIQKLNPQVEVIVDTDANRWATEADAVVTATSAYDQKIVEVERLKPGCVVCDCSRPLDFSLEDAIKRPDVLIIESGEIVLPGPVEMTCDIGLPRNVFYACLGETAILAMEKRYEPFTLGKDIDWLKVKEIYRLAKDHGVGLAAIRGHAGLVSDREIEIVCRRAGLIRQS